MGTLCDFLYVLVSCIILALRLVEGQKTCYTSAFGEISLQPGWYACEGTATSPGGAETCCLPNSLCGPDSLCRIPPSEGKTTDNWYLGGCTDETYEDPVCRTECCKLDF